MHVCNFKINFILASQEDVKGTEHKREKEKRERKMFAPEEGKGEDGGGGCMGRT